MAFQAGRGHEHAISQPVTTAKRPVTRVFRMDTHRAMTKGAFVRRTICGTTVSHRVPFELSCFAECAPPFTFPPPLPKKSGADSHWPAS